MGFKKDFIKYYKNNGVCTPKYCLIHCTGGANNKAAYNWLKENPNGTSAHILIETDGECTQFVPSKFQAYHAGVGKYDSYVNNLNSVAIGFEIVNATLAIKKINEGGQYRDLYGCPIENIISINGVPYHEYEKIQISETARMVKYYMEIYGIPIKNVIGHSDYAPNRKPDDPGKHFPWDYFRELIRGGE